MKKNLINNKSRLVMGIINRTPDSFYDGGKNYDLKEALKNIEKMVKDGVEILDIGGESTRPGSSVLSVEEEIERVIPLIKEVKRNFDLPISLDTYKYEVMKIGLDNGVDIINDIYSLSYNEKCPKLISEYDVPVVIMHMKGNPTNMQVNPSYENVINEISSFFEEKIKLLTNVYNIKKENIIIDPGVGFGKRLIDNISIVNNLQNFTCFDLPVLIGLSRKSFIGKILQNDFEDRLIGTLIFEVIAYLKGINIFRVHDVKETLQLIKLLKSLELVQ